MYVCVLLKISIKTSAKHLLNARAKIVETYKPAETLDDRREGGVLSETSLVETFCVTRTNIFAMSFDM